MPNIGPLEIIIVLVIILVIFGPKRLPELGRSMGRGMREFKDSVTGNDKDDDEQRQELSPPATAVQQAAPPMQVQNRPAPAPPAGQTPGDQNPAEQPVQTGEQRP
jgi:sec-independent protein translocase protein TatA